MSEAEFNVIFLDIDGVLNSNFWNQEHQKEISDGTLVDETKIELLSKLVKDCSASVILHSGWKYWFDEEIKPMRNEAKVLQEMLSTHGISIAGITPDFADDEIKRTKKFSLVKAKEILSWVDEHPGCNWIVIDDLDLHNDIVFAHQIMTDNTKGLTEADVDKAMELLANSN